MANEETQKRNPVMSALGWGFRAFIWDKNDSLASNVAKLGLTAASVVAAPFSGGSSLAGRAALHAGVKVATRSSFMGGILTKIGGVMEAAAPKLVNLAKPLFTKPLRNTINQQVTGRAISIPRSAATMTGVTLATGNVDSAIEATAAVASVAMDSISENAINANRVLDDPIGSIQSTAEDLMQNRQGHNEGPTSNPAGNQSNQKSPEGPEEKEAKIVNDILDQFGLSGQGMTNLITDNKLAFGLGGLMGLNTEGGLIKKTMMGSIYGLLLAPLLKICAPFIKPFTEFMGNFFQKYIPAQQPAPQPSAQARTQAATQPSAPATAAAPQQPAVQPDTAPATPSAGSTVTPGPEIAHLTNNLAAPDLKEQFTQHGAPAPMKQQDPNGPTLAFNNVASLPEPEKPFFIIPGTPAANDTLPGHAGLQLSDNMAAQNQKRDIPSMPMFSTV